MMKNVEIIDSPNAAYVDQAVGATISGYGDQKGQENHEGCKSRAGGKI